MKKMRTRSGVVIQAPRKFRTTFFVFCATFAIISYIIAVVELSTFFNMLEILEQDAGESRMVQLIFSAAGAIPFIIGMISIGVAVTLSVFLFTRSSK